MIMGSHHLIFIFIFIFIFINLISQTSSAACNGIYITYTYKSGLKLPPNTTLQSSQPYRFESTATILNNALQPLKSWQLFVGFHNKELLVSASQAVLVDGSTFPAHVGNGTVFAGFPATDLNTAVDTAGDLTQMMANIDFVGTQFGVNPPNVPMPLNISLLNNGFSCPSAVQNGTNEMHVCCVEDVNFKANVTEEEFLPRQQGDLTMDYDILRSYESEYYAQVRISNHNSLGRLDNWKLSWDWMRDEFIQNMKGAYPSVVDATDCIYGSQGVYYKDLDFSTVLNCEKRPTIVDLPLTKANDSTLGLIPFCCRDGTILPPSMDPSKSQSVFQIQVKKMPPDLNRTEIFPPQNWKINGTLNPDYVCGPPVRVSPSLYPDPSGLAFNKTSVASWQVVCNITQPKGSHPRCCVSFSAFYNDSVIPCKTCACGCSGRQICSSTTPALLLPPNALLVPFVNRTAKAKAWSIMKRRTIPDPLPCGDNCGVSINWHVSTDYTKGWSARVTLFNWGDTNFADWFAAMEFAKAGPGFESMYSFNGSSLPTPPSTSTATSNTIFMQGLPGLNYLVAERDGADPLKDPRVPGKQQSVISFTKKRTKGISVAAGDGFPTRVFFNGEECSMPDILPTSSSHITDGSPMILAILLGVAVLMLMQQ